MATYNSDGYAATDYFLANEEFLNATSIAISAGAGAIESVMSLLSDSYSAVGTVGGIDSVMDLWGDGYSVSQGAGDVLSTMSLLGDGYAVAVSHARLSFPSIWQGKLSLLSNHTKYEIRTLT